MARFRFGSRRLPAYWHCLRKIGMRGEREEEAKEARRWLARELCNYPERIPFPNENVTGVSPEATVEDSSYFT